MAPGQETVQCNLSLFILAMEVWKIVSLLENLSQHLPQTLQATLSYPLAQCMAQCQKFIIVMCTKVKLFFPDESVLFVTQFILENVCSLFPAFPGYLKWIIYPFPSLKKKKKYNIFYLSTTLCVLHFFLNLTANASEIAAANSLSILGWSSLRLLKLKYLISGRQAKPLIQVGNKSTKSNLILVI